MKNLKFIAPLFAVIITVGMFACMKGKEMTTNAGFRYILYTDNKGPNPQIGDYVTLDLVYRNAEDSVFFDSRTNPKPFRFQLEKIPFQGSYEDGLTYLCQGDSATFYVPADSMYAYYITRRGETIPQEQTVFKKGSFFKFDIKLLRIQTMIEAEQEILIEKSSREKAGMKIFNQYVTDHHWESNFDSAGYYMEYIKKGSGSPVDTGAIISVNFTGKFLDGRVFDSSEQMGHPYRFVLNTRQVIGGWELAFRKLKVGDNVNLLLPSQLAYGEAGMRDPKNGTYIVPSYAPLLFEIEVLKVEKLNALVKK
ncbi:MAG: FKBP-type peptidyl-prolyl cis-trans isomerase [Bacteroidetes bacterium]|nr:FKBP-type peptidyl-prolyl cis-trans isomerase [Bacteroidota bacterium]MBL0139453.1 FKBP-type peptidyl-prolyl cis-trans isomerase [Bacteroidota bacterium]